MKATYCKVCKKKTKSSVENWCWVCKIGKGKKFACYKCGDRDADTGEGFCKSCYDEVF